MTRNEVIDSPIARTAGRDPTQQRSELGAYTAPTIVRVNLTAITESIGGLGDDDVALASVPV